MQTFLEEVNEKINGVPIQRCYHCRKCTAGCPATPYMEYNINKVIKMIQNGQREDVLNSSTIWLCMSCETCITRCPNEVDIARMMDVLRQMAIESGIGAREKNVLKFHEAFLSGIKMGGRINEADDDGSVQTEIGRFVFGCHPGPGHVSEGKARACFSAHEGFKVGKRYF